jgi:hypothetical protein
MIVCCSLGRLAPQSEYHSGRIASHDTVRRDVGSNYRTSGDHASGTNLDPWENDASDTDPDVIANNNRPDLIVSRWPTSQPSRRVSLMAVGIQYRRIS